MPPHPHVRAHTHTHMHMRAHTSTCKRTPWGPGSARRAAAHAAAQPALSPALPGACHTSRLSASPQPAALRGSGRTHRSTCAQEPRRHRVDGKSAFHLLSTISAHFISTGRSARESGCARPKGPKRKGLPRQKGLPPTGRSKLGDWVCARDVQAGSHASHALLAFWVTSQ